MIAGRGHCGVLKAPRLYHNTDDPVVHLQEDSKGVRSPLSLILFAESAPPEYNMGQNSVRTDQSVFLRYFCMCLQSHIFMILLNVYSHDH